MQQNVVRTCIVSVLVGVTSKAKMFFIYQCNYYDATVLSVSGRRHIQHMKTDEDAMTERMRLKLMGKRRNLHVIQAEV